MNNKAHKAPEDPPEGCQNSPQLTDKFSGCVSQGRQSAEMKRAVAKQQIERYYYQLTDGCGHSDCTNAYCASSPAFRRQNATRDELAILAIDLYKSKSQFCESQAVRPTRTTGQQGGESSTMFDVDMVDSTVDSSPAKGKKVKLTEETVSTTNAMSPPPAVEEIKYLTETRLLDIISDCERAADWSPLIRMIGEVFSSPQSLVVSFRKVPVEKEEIRAREIEDKDEDEGDSECERAAVSDESDLMAAVQLAPSVSRAKLEITCDCDVDVDSLRRAYEALARVPQASYQGALGHALTTLAKNIEVDLKYNRALERDPSYVNIFVIVMEMPFLQSPEFVESVYPMVCRAMANMSVDGQAKLAKIWSTFSAPRLVKLLESLQQLVTVRVINGESRWGPRPGSLINDDDAIAAAVRLMKVVYYASLLGGRWDSERVLTEESERVQADNTAVDLLHGAVAYEPKEPRPSKPDPMASALSIVQINCRSPLIGHEEFVNEPLNDCLDVASDYAYYRAEVEEKFSFIDHSFILTTANKHMSMYYDNRMRMLNERRTSLLRAIVHGAPTSPYLRVRVRRDHIIADSLVALEMVAMDNPQDLKKQLIVEFEGEQGLDEGGISKEFFQLIVEQMFNPDFGMFTCNDETQQFWFNPTSFENDAQFVLIGIILGLAIYNNAILDVHFPFVVYRKLLAKLGTLEDLSDFDPVLSRSLHDILSSDGDIETEFMQTFQIGYRDIFGAFLTHDLVPGGDTIPVTAQNRQEFVDAYVDFLLNKSVAKQFRAFKHGFRMVTNESPLDNLFRPVEIELLVCGSKIFDFNELEDATEYDGGFYHGSDTIRNFWEVVHDFSDEQKRKLLQFTTGTDRVPVGGLAKLRLIIARNGPDSDRLPTSHTCFNVLLLPDYSSKDKLHERLLKAMTYSKGFGML